MMPPSAIVSPSCTVTWVFTERFEIVGEGSAALGAGPGVLTSWLNR